jgi:hypothetical protein
MSKITSTQIKHGNKFYTPDVIGKNTLTTTEAISELVANSFDWCITKNDETKKTELTIYVTPEKIKIVDNGVGMTLEQLEIAKDFARAQEKFNKRNEIKNVEDRKGMYGMGMKVAALTLGWKYTIVTKSINEPSVHHVFEFDSTRLKDENSDYLSKLEILTYDEHMENSPLNDFESGTSILIEQLTDKGKVPSVSTLKDALTQRFWPQIESLQKQGKLEFKIIDGDEGNVDNTYLATKIVRPAFEHEVLKLDFERPKYCKKAKYEYIGSDGKVHQLKGFIQLLKQRDFQGNYGINVYIRNQLVAMFEKESFGIIGRTYEKIYGEIDLTGAVAGNVKNAIQNDIGYQNVVKLIKDDLEGIYKKLGTPTGKATDLIREEIQRRLSEVNVNGDKTDNKKEIVKKDITKSREEINEFPEGMPANVVKISDTIYYHICKKPSVQNDLEFAWKALPVNSKLQFSNCQLFELYVRVNTNSALFNALKDQMQGRELETIQTFFYKVAICESLLEIIKENHDIKNARSIIDKNVYPAVIKMKF